MIEFFLWVFFLALGLWFLLGPALAIGALRRAKRLERDLVRVQRRLSEFDRSGPAREARTRDAPAVGPRPSPESAAAPRVSAPTGRSWSEEGRAAAEAPPHRAESDETTPSAPAPREDAAATAAQAGAHRGSASERVAEPADSADSATPLVVRAGDTAPSAPKRSAIEWERWIGVRGAALLGGVLFALAAIFLYQHAVEQQWITPLSRVIGGTSAGLLLVVASEVLKRREFRHAPGAVAAAGTVALYASAWAANSLYALIGDAQALAAFAATTALCVGLAIRHDSQAVAVLGLLGGFATPVALALPQEGPIGLFGYLLLLNTGMLLVGRHRAWTSLGLLTVAGTLALEAYWVLHVAGPEHAVLGLTFLATLAGLFLVLRPVGRDVSRESALLAHLGVVVAPMLLAAHFAHDLAYELDPWVLGGYGALLLGGSLVLARRRRTPALAAAAAASLVAVLFAWSLERELAGSAGATLCALSGALAVVFTVVGRIEGGASGLWAGYTLTTGLLVVLVISSGAAAASQIPDTPWPWFLASGLGLLALVADRRTAWARCAPVFLGGLLAGFALIVRADPDQELAPHPLATLGAFALFGVLLGATGFVAGRREDRSAVAAAALGLAPLLLLVPRALLSGHGEAYFATCGGLALILAALAAVARSGWPLLAASALSAWKLTNLPGLLASDPWFGDTAVQGAPATLGVAFAVLGTTALIAAWPALLLRRFARVSLAWRVAAWTAPLHALAWIDVLEARTGDAWELLAPGGLALLLALVHLFGARRLDDRPAMALGTSPRGIAGALLLGIAVPFAATAVALPLERPFPVLFLALSGGGLAVVARTQRHPGPALAAVVALGLSALAYAAAGWTTVYAASDLVLWNRFGADGWTLAAGAGIATWCFTREDRAHLPAAERYSERSVRLLAGGTALALAVALFQWIDFAVFSVWAEGEHVVLSVDHLPPRDLTLSTCWIVYGLAWLGVGLWKRLSAARWLSLVVLLIALSKVFLFDLAHLEGLYRVASLFGLGLSLVVVSLLYQRFVFPHSAAEDEASDRAGPAETQSALRKS